MEEKEIAVVGAAGRMGKSIIELLSDDLELTIGMGVEHPDSVVLGWDMSSMYGGMERVNKTVTASREKAFRGCAGVIDFSSPKSTQETLRWALEYRVPLVIGTTGLTDQQKAEIREAGSVIPVLLSPNMSLGVNMLFVLVRTVARALKGEGFDAEIIEAHHRHKKDAPSGTAKRLLEVLAEEYKAAIPDDIYYGRKGKMEFRRPKEIGVHALRAGGIVGMHTVLFASWGEQIELTHRAQDREVFAKGAVAAMKFLLKSKPGYYSMIDVLGL